MGGFILIRIKIILIPIFLLFLSACSGEDYFFNKNEFQRDHVTYMAYEDYRKPMRLEFVFWGHDPSKDVFSLNEEEIRFVFHELKNSLQIGSEAEKNKLIKQVPRYASVIVRRMDTEDGGEIVLNADVNVNKVSEVYEGVKITEELWDYLQVVEQREAYPTQA
jgi:hypothetical protein